MEKSRTNGFLLSQSYVHLVSQEHLASQEIERDSKDKEKQAPAAPIADLG